MSGSPLRFHYSFPLTLSLSKGVQALFQQPARVHRRSAAVERPLCSARPDPAGSRGRQHLPIPRIHGAKRASTRFRSLRSLPLSVGGISSCLCGPAFCRVLELTEARSCSSSCPQAAQRWCGRGWHRWIIPTGPSPSPPPSSATACLRGSRHCRASARQYGGPCTLGMLAYGRGVIVALRASSVAGQEYLAAGSNGMGRNLSKRRPTLHAHRSRNGLHASAGPQLRQRSASTT